MINSLILKTFHIPNRKTLSYTTDSYFPPKYLNVYSHNLGGSTSLAVVITSNTFKGQHMS